MDSTSVAAYSGRSRIKLFLALSRTPHAVLDIATPASSALLWLGEIPPLKIVILGLITAFAGYTAVYALNDLVDYHIDKKKMESCHVPCTCKDLDAVYVRHPLAQGLLSFQETIVWTAGWGFVALLGAWLLNPVSAVLFLGGCLAEAVYCLLLRVSWMRALVSGIVKTVGGLAAVFAVEPQPSALFIFTLTLWLFSWEIGGQNIPNDLADLEHDHSMGAKTIPVCFGAGRAARMIVYTLFLATVLSLIVYGASPARLGLIYLPGAIAVAYFLLLKPASSLYRDQSSAMAADLFNRSSYYPFAMFLVVMLSLL